EMIGGMQNLYKVLKYPEIARLAGMEGKVVIQLLIDENGVPSNPIVLRSAWQILNDAAKEALLKQRFKPGRQRGKAVRVQMAFPVTFELG
ncbi:MAG: energy transducer TonB, partial [Rhodothermia bacterium]